MLKKIDIDKLNILLIFISLALAIILPFKLFLWSYAVLGPLHYLTEINWLHNKNYFVKQKKAIWINVFLSIIFTIPILIYYNPTVLTLIQTNKIAIEWYNRVVYYLPFILIISIIFSIALTYYNKKKSLFSYLIISIVLAYIINKFYGFSLFVTVFVPSLIHVYFFTLIFMLFGAIKEKSKFGFLSAFILSTIPFIVMFLPQSFLIPESSLALKNELTAINFHVLIEKIAQYSGAISSSEKIDLNSLIAIRIQMFLAFAYTYHYLNWFSKTSKIAWDKSINSSKMIIIVVLWLLSIALYWYNYHLGFIVLYTISLLHVILEFPLNYISIKEVALSLKQNVFKSK